MMSQFDSPYQPAATRLPPEELAARAVALRERLRACDICPHACGADRLAGQVGRCRIGAQARIASSCVHRGEEPAISGSRGSGTIFLAGCNLRCVFCQNHQISQGPLDAFDPVDADGLAEIFLSLQRQGCHNLNWVSPTHAVPQLVAALAIAVPRGFALPIVYNSNGHDSLSVLQMLDGIVDIYLPDLKYADAEAAYRLSGAPNYPDIAITAIREMFRQVGPVVQDDDGIARRGVVVRHLVLPNGLSGTREAMRRLANEVSPRVTVSLMAQYYPTYRATGITEVSRSINVGEYEEAIDGFCDAGLTEGWAQDVCSAPDTYQPDFTREHPFER